jgi:putative sterol carrier protein
VAEYLSDAWLAGLAAIPRPDAAAVRLTIQQRITGGPDGDIAYVVRVTDDDVALEAGSDAAADVTITEDWPTAIAIHNGTLSAAEAMASGRIRVGGSVTRLLEHATLLEAAHA